MLAVEQELEVRRLGLQPFSDPSPWERLSRDQQKLFNTKYRALKPELQEFSSRMFNSAPDRILEHAFAMFINYDIDLLSQVIARELEEEREDELLRQRNAKQQQQVEQQRIAKQREQQRLRKQQQQQQQQVNRFNLAEFNELPRSQVGNQANSLTADESQVDSRRRRPGRLSQDRLAQIDPRRRQRKPPVPQEQPRATEVPPKQLKSAQLPTKTVQIQQQQAQLPQQPVQIPQQQPVKVPQQQPAQRPQQQAVVSRPQQIPQNLVRQNTTPVQQQQF